WDQPQPLSISEILQAGTMPPRLAAVFWLGLERGASFAFAADPPGAGKTTVLTALLAFAPADTVAYFTQGWGETFDLPPPNDGYPTYLMVNEMSDHLPVYSWGPYVVRIFELLTEGYSLCTTLHADTVEDVVEQLEDEVGVPRPHLAHLTFVVPLAIARRDGSTLRRVRDVGLLSDGDGGLAVQRIAAWDERHDSFSVLEQPDERALLAGRLGLDGEQLERELERREAFLERLLADGVYTIDGVQAAIGSFRREG
ncbi:MAG: hypothetical protein Q8S13_13730, partial [Dehalococcoidia bacterium]|nr:hypothetical protein [Dehalococcoidia bacterium]